jgi:hypothetical protein
MREDYRHFGARSTAKIGPAKRHHTDDHHVIAKTDLRAGIVKARRPRVRAGGAQRRALHDAEHRSSIESVMVGASDEVQFVALRRAHKRATTVFAADAGSVARSRPNKCDFVTRISRTNGTGLSEELRSVPRANM